VASRISIVASVASCIALSAATAVAQTRFQAADASAIAGVSGLRIVSVRDTLRNRCYLAFVADQAGSEIVPAQPSDIGAAAVQRDRDLADLIHSYESDTSVFAGTITPNPLKYQVLAQTTQINYMLTAIQSMLARLEEQLDRARNTSRTALAVVPDVCASAETRATPP
jgi:hypothetical protein